MNKPDDSGSAFPLPLAIAPREGYQGGIPMEFESLPGMSRLEVYALFAMHALIAAPDDDDEPLPEAIERISRVAYQYADAMLKTGKAGAA